MSAGTEAYVRALNALGMAKQPDREADHSEADQILIDALRDNGMADVADAWERARERVGFWYA